MYCKHRPKQHMEHQLSTDPGETGWHRLQLGLPLYYTALSEIKRDLQASAWPNPNAELYPDQTVRDHTWLVDQLQPWTLPPSFSKSFPPSPPSRPISWTPLRKVTDMNWQRGEATRAIWFPFIFLTCTGKGRRRESVRFKNLLPIAEKKKKKLRHQLYSNRTKHDEPNLLMRVVPPSLPSPDTHVLVCSKNNTNIEPLEKAL